MARAWPGMRVKYTPSSATTCPPPSPKVCLRPSTESIGPTGGEGQVVAFGEESLVGAPQGRLVLDEQHFTPRAKRGGTHGGPIYAGPPCRLRAAQLGLLSSSNRSSSLVSTSKNRSSSLAPRRHTVRRRSAAFRWINIRPPRPALSIWRVPAR